MQKRNNELSPKEFSEILDDPLFSNVRYVGVSGGEPTLRNDLPEIFEVLVKKSPRILGVGIITNAIQENQVIGRISRAAVICSKAGLPFNIMVSLDGIGPIHDRIRGHSGNFDSAMSVIRYFQDHTVIPLSIGCTITKENVWNIDDVLDYCRNEGIYGRFRIAEFINRL
ncbi:hypothetical protein KA005_23230 [bacterium]|nr:hypothetical protein [bacterium]